MKYGGVASQPAWLDNNVDLLRRMGATTARISMFWGNAETRRYADWQLDRLRSAGLTELIIQSGETADAAKVERELGQVIGYIEAHPHTLFVYELGNEPDWHGEDPYIARYKRLTTLRDVRPRYDRPNLLWAVNQCQSACEAWYFDAFNRDAGDGLGGMIYSPAAGVTYTPYAPDLVTVHCYSTDTLCPHSGEPASPWRVLDWVRGWSTRVNIKVTEAGIHNAAIPDRGQRYVEFVAQLDERTGGQVDSVCIYALPEVDGDPVGAAYNLRAFEADQIGSRVPTAYCP